MSLAPEPLDPAAPAGRTVGPRLYGVVDVLRADRIAGWAIDRADSAAAVEVDICREGRSSRRCAPTGSAGPGARRRRHRPLRLCLRAQPPLEPGFEFTVSATARTADGVSCELRRTGVAGGDGDPDRRLVERIFELVSRPSETPDAPVAGLEQTCRTCSQRLEVAQARIEAALAAVEPPPPPSLARPQADARDVARHWHRFARTRARLDVAALRSPAWRGPARSSSSTTTIPAQFGAFGHWLAGRGWEVAFATAAPRRPDRRRRASCATRRTARRRARPTPTPSRWTAPRCAPRPSCARRSRRGARATAPTSSSRIPAGAPGMFAKDVFPEAAFVAYCEWWYRHPGPGRGLSRGARGPRRCRAPSRRRCTSGHAMRRWRWTSRPPTRRSARPSSRPGSSRRCSAGRFGPARRHRHRALPPRPGRPRRDRWTG